MGAGRQNRDKRARSHGGHKVKPSRWRLLVDGSWRRRGTMQGCGAKLRAIVWNQGLGPRLALRSISRPTLELRDKRARLWVRTAIGPSS